MELITKIKIKPSDQQKDVLLHLSNECRLLYNYYLSERIRMTTSLGRNISFDTQKRQLHELRNEEKHYNAVNVKVLQNIIRTLDNDYKHFFKQYNNNHSVKPPKFKGKKYFMKMIFDKKNKSFEIKNGKIFLMHKYNNVNLVFKLPKSLFSKNISYIELYNTKPYKFDGDFELKIVCQIKEKKYYDNGKYQSFDLGLKKIVTAINSDGKVFELSNKHINRYWDLIIRKLKIKLDGCKIHSRRWFLLYNKINKLTLKKRNAMNNYLHVMSKKVVNNTKANTLIVGNMSVTKPLEMNKGFSKLHFDTQNKTYLFNFIDMLSYKAKFVGKKVVIIDESHTSKKCFVCGKSHNKMTVHHREMKCECGNVIDRDINSSINIMIRFLSQNAKWTGYEDFLHNLRQTGLLNKRNTLVKIPKGSPNLNFKSKNKKKVKHFY